MEHRLSPVIPSRVGGRTKSGGGRERQSASGGDLAPLLLDSRCMLQCSSRVLKNASCDCEERSDVAISHLQRSPRPAHAGLAMTFSSPCQCSKCSTALVFTPSGRGAIMPRVTQAAPH